MTTGLDALLDRNATADTAAVADTVSDTAATGTATQDTGVDTTQVAADTTTQAVATPAVDVEKGLQAALLAERQKRQIAEAALAAKTPAEKPDFWEDPEARLADMEARTEQRLVAQKLDMSEAFARSKYADFDEKFDIFAAMLVENPALYSQMIQQVDPAEFLYKTATNQQKLKEMGDPTDFETKLREKITAEVEAKYKAQSEEEAKKRGALPGSIATTAGAGGAAAATWSGPAPLSDILK